jgi:hypothetical protein
MAIKYELYVIPCISLEENDNYNGIFKNFNAFLYYKTGISTLPFFNILLGTQNILLLLEKQLIVKIKILNKFLKNITEKYELYVKNIN